jgi:hypothetical protein
MVSVTKRLSCPPAKDSAAKDDNHRPKRAAGRRALGKEKDRHRQTRRQQESEQGRQVRGANDDRAGAHAADHKSQEDLSDYRQNREHHHPAHTPAQSSEQRTKSRKQRPARIVIDAGIAAAILPP